MFCGKCGNSIPDGDVFCSICGTSINDSPIQPSVQPAVQHVQTVPIVIATPQTNQVNRKNGMATVGLVFGILASISSLATISSNSSDSFEFASIIMVVYSLAILGVIFSAIGISKSRKSGSKGKAVTGLILSICAFFTPVLTLGMGTYMNKANNSSLSIDNNQSSYVLLLDE